MGDDKEQLPSAFSWTWPEIEVRMNLQSGYSGMPQTIQLYVSGRWGGGCVTMPLWAWERIREASFCRPAEGRSEQVVRVVLEQPPQAPQAPQAVLAVAPSAAPVPSGVQRALENLDRPVPRKGG
jgi:hypothetical protein